MTTQAEALKRAAEALLNEAMPGRPDNEQPLFADPSIEAINALADALALPPEPPCADCDEMTRQRDHYRAERDRLQAIIDNRPDPAKYSMAWTSFYRDTQRYWDYHAPAKSGGKGDEK